MLPDMLTERANGRLRAMHLWCVVVAGALLSAPVIAQPRQGTAPRMAVVVESGQGSSLGVRIRALLSEDSGILVQSLEAFANQGQRPDLVVTITVSAGREIHVMYWDRLGVADSLDAPVPKAAANIGLVAASLSAALVRRNLPALTAALKEDPTFPHYGARGHARSELSSLSPAQLRLFLSRLADRSPRTDRLTVADF